MFKAIIAEDEPKICQLILRLADWEELGIEVVGTADNGIDAFELICRHKPKIVITDIRMPGFDGLEMIRKVKELGLDTKFIIISGYRHFEYAHNALKYNVEEYLLKPIKKSELNDVLKKICNCLIADGGKIKRELEIESQLVNSRDSLRRHFINSIIFSQDVMADIKIDKANQEYQLNFKNGIFEAFIIKIDSRSKDEAVYKLDKILEKLCELTEKMMGEKCNEVITSMTHSGVVCIINYNEINMETVKKSKKLLFDNIKNHLDFFGDFSLTIGVGSCQSDISKVYKSIQTGMEAVKARVILGVDRIINADNLRFKSMGVSEILSGEKEKQLINIIEALDTDGLQLWLYDLFSVFHGNTDINPSLAFEVCETIADLYIQTIRRLGLNTEHEKPFKNEINNGLDCATSINEINNYMYETIAANMGNLMLEKRNQDNKPIRIAKQYINEHYMEQIRLDDIADLVHLNPAYFSTLFKKETSLNFSDYVINLRLDAAKELLKSTNSSMEEIAEKIGYSETKYFSKLFSKVVGIKPSEYRKLYS